MSGQGKDMDIAMELENLKDSFENRLDLFWQSRESVDIPKRLRESMIYSLKAGGKRIRPILCMKASEYFGISHANSFPLALGLEMIHTASLIHDDLPSMDNDTLRRGKPTNHVVFGETLALLAGTSLFLYGIQIPLQLLPSLGFDPERINASITGLAKAAGPEGIHGGQTLDTDRESQKDSPEFVWEIARLKTASLITTSIEAGSLLGGAPEKDFSILSAYGNHLGLAFQIVDDILDIKSEASVLGKTPGKDIVQEKRTFVSSFGLEKASRIAIEETGKALDLARELGPGGLFFQKMALFLQERSH